MATRYLDSIVVTGTEKDFMTNVINYITGIDSKITCSSNVDTEYDSSDLTHVPTFNFLIDGELAFTIARKYALNTNAREFIVSCENNSFACGIGGESRSYSTNGKRTVSFSYINNDNFVLLTMHSMYENHSSGTSNNYFSIIYVKNSAKSYYSTLAVINGPAISKSVVFDISSRTFTEISDSSSISGIFISRFSYKAQPGKIDYIKDSIYVANGSKAFDLTSVYDCSELSSVGDPVSLNDGVYIAVGPHQLVKVS